MTLPIFVVDAFIVEGKAFTGNAAGVVLLEFDDDISDEKKQQIAEEMNLSETAFVSFGWTKGNKLAAVEGTAQRTLRWFTPTNEVPLCGHATVASAKVIANVQLQEGGEKSISFDSKFRGKLGADLQSDGSVSLNFPSNPTHVLNQDENPWLPSVIQHCVGSKDLVDGVHYSPGTKILLIRLKDELTAEGLRSVRPNFQALLDIDTGNFLRDIIVTVKGGSTDSPDFFSRFFAPWDGINEDPVTGLAHTVLTPFWTKELGKVGPLKARQHSTRGGDLECTLLGDRVKITGQARIGLKGQLFI
ncbi:phenazine biosynthesis-like domain-containing protein [Folsomia candida]|uniref:Phenazine biosynthesis-like domain-containing protein n=1 Tax=Folsomia candida TaxID=158441 RepID=A0A226ERJ9_FOLCA|nr:phenazine biosynthesis-like domain-containing protein [Folsomia candida]OXA60253.1 Phenazine biosynthesis-like domain-containing protein [Folsomia candida]